MKLNDCLFVTGGKIYNDDDLPYRKSGCAALDMAYVASGRYDGYFQQNLNLVGYSCRNNFSRRGRRNFK